MGYTLQATVPRPYDRTVADVRAALADQGFGVLTEIDLRATFKTKLDVDISPQVILGACRPALAYQALQVDPSIATVLPCNVVVRAAGADTTVVEAFDPAAMMGLSGDDGLDSVATDARHRITAMLAALKKENSWSSTPPV
jgi:uncharacterized protein (DUF302 family)